MKTVTTIMGEFDFKRADAFRKVFKATETDFTFEGKTVVYNFAKFMVEYLEIQFKF